MTARKPRSDAARNRERLIDAAKEILGRGGPEASLGAVARHAGVGAGTLYRHFPTREALFQAIYRQEVEHLVTLADTLQAEPDALAALRVWMRAFVGLVATKRGVLGALSVVPTDASKQLYADLSVRLTEALDRLLNHGTRSGALRGGIGAEDLLLTMLGLCYARPPEPGWERQVIRLLDVFADGLKA